MMFTICWKLKKLVQPSASVQLAAKLVQSGDGPMDRFTD